jgi:hypothetical protein
VNESKELPRQQARTQSALEYETRSCTDGRTKPNTDQERLLQIGHHLFLTKESLSSQVAGSFMGAMTFMDGKPPRKKSGNASCPIAEALQTI